MKKFPEGFEPSLTSPPLGDLKKAPTDENPNSEL
jgi:hypothetical protein